MAQSKTLSYILELEMRFNPDNPMSVLQKLETIAISIYNAILNEGLKRLHKVQHARTYQQALAQYKTLLKKDKLTAEEQVLKKELQKTKNTVCRQYGFTEYDLHAYVKTIKHHFHDQLGINECQKLATRAFRALQKLQFGQAQRIRFKSTKREWVSIENKTNKSGIRFDPAACCIRYKQYSFPLIVKRNDAYAVKTLMDKVKYVRLVPKTIRGRQRWFAQLVLEGRPPHKSNRQIGAEDSVVGLDLGVSTIAMSSKNEVRLEELAPDCAADERKLRILNRKLDRSRRAMNPDHFNPDGTIKKSKKLKWKQSKHYQQLKAKRADLYRKVAVKRKAAHEQLANEILALGTDVRVEDMHFQGLQKRSGQTTGRPNGKLRSKKRYGRTLGNRAPALLLEILNRKLLYRGECLHKVNTWTVKASQFNPLTGEFRKKPLSERMTELLPDVWVQRDLLAAYVLQHTNSALDQIDFLSVQSDFVQFQALHDCEIQRLKQIHQLSWYIN